MLGWCVATTQARTGYLTAGGAVRRPPGVTAECKQPSMAATSVSAGTTRKTTGGFEFVASDGVWKLSADADPCASKFYTAFLDFNMATWPGPWKTVSLAMSKGVRLHQVIKFCELCLVPFAIDFGDGLFCRHAFY
jgi:hypothetical protein